MKQKSPPYSAALLLLTLILTSCLPASADTTRQVRAATRQDNTVLAPPTQPVQAMIVPLGKKEPRLPDDIEIAGVVVGGMRVSEARSILEQTLAPLTQPLLLATDGLSVTVGMGQIDFAIPYDDLLAQASAAGTGSRIALGVVYNRDKLWNALTDLSTQSAISTTFTISETLDGPVFAIHPGQQIDLGAALERSEQSLQDLSQPRDLYFELKSYQDPNAFPTLEQLQDALADIEEGWNGILGAYVYDLSRDQEIGGYQPGTVFSAASVMKAAIMLHAYAKLPSFTATQEKWLSWMIINSDNDAANRLFAASVGGTSATHQAKGALSMTAMLEELGLEHTYQRSPYAIAGVKAVVLGKPGPAKEGDPPYTIAGPYLRATPGEMTQVFRWINECATGQGPLPQAYPETLTPERCAEMISRLEQNADKTRMVAGLPEGTVVAHKSGWIEDTQGDAGIVRSPNGDYAVTVYVYRPEKQFRAGQAAATIARANRLIYSYFNPIGAE